VLSTSRLTWRQLLGLAAIVAALAWLGHADPARAQTPAASRPAAMSPVERGPRWKDLSADQQAALKPLEREWSGIDAERKQKWLAISVKYPTMSPDERSRIQARMTEWAKLSPQERGVARQQFQTAKQVAPQDRREQWEAYQALPTEQKRQLAARAAPSASGASFDRQRRSGLPERGEKAAPTQAKSNIVPNPALAAPPKPVAALALQAQPGATTTSIAKRAAPPSHEQTGLPKIAGSQGFVDRTTLLPQRGPQGAAARSAAASSEPTRHR
jgi:Protein of unknown function (DUF3106)